LGLTCARVQTEVQCALSWFSNWSNDQRRIFVEQLLEENQEENLMRHLRQMSLAEVHS